jgi:hypothetical protein
MSIRGETCVTNKNTLIMLALLFFLPWKRWRNPALLCFSSYGWFFLYSI